MSGGELPPGDEPTPAGIVPPGQAAGEASSVSAPTACICACPDIPGQSLWLALPIPVLVADARSRKILDANPIALMTIGSPREHVVGSRLDRFLSPACEQPPASPPLVPSVPAPCERSLMTVGGRAIPVLDSVSWILDSDHRIELHAFQRLAAPLHQQEQTPPRERSASLSADGLAHAANLGPPDGSVALGSDVPVPAIDRSTTGSQRMAALVPPSPAAPDRSVLNLEDALARLEGDRALLADLADLLLEDVPRSLDELHKAVLGGDDATVRRMAHGIRGGVSNVGASEMADAARDLEQAANERRGAQYDLLLDAVRGAWVRLESELQVIRRNFAAETPPSRL